MVYWSCLNCINAVLCRVRVYVYVSPGIFIWDNYVVSLKVRYFSAEYFSVQLVPLLYKHDVIVQE